MTLVPLPAFADNFHLMLHDGSRAIVVDPGDARPVFDTPAGSTLQLAAILVTHHHANHARRITPILRSREATATAAVPKHAALRQWKNDFR